MSGNQETVGSAISWHFTTTFLFCSISALTSATSLSCIFFLPLAFLSLSHVCNGNCRISCIQLHLGPTSSTLTPSLAKCHAHELPTLAVSWLLLLLHCSAVCSHSRLLGFYSFRCFWHFVACFDFTLEMLSIAPTKTCRVHGGGGQQNKLMP